MDRRGFVTTGIAAGLAGAGGTTAALETALRRSGPWWSPRSSDADGIIKLSSNENPLGIAPAAREAVLGSLDIANRYPGELRGEMTRALARKHGVPEGSVILGAGSTEILQMAVQAYEAPRVRLVIAEPTFEDVPRYQRPFAYELEAVPLTTTHAHDLDRMRGVAERARRPSIVYLCNPNNPTGTLTSCRDTDAWIEDAPETTLFLVDEAYFEYADDPGYWSALPWIQDRPNVIVVRTFSKIYGMAGMRLGFGFAHPDTAQRLREFMSSNNANQLALAAGLASLADAELEPRSVGINQEARTIVHRTLAELDLEVLPSHTNFVMHRIQGSLSDYRSRMLERGIRVGRDFPPMLEWNRLSLGLPEEMEQWSEAIRDFRRHGWV